jgi:hypothetical protein
MKEEESGQLTAVRRAISRIIAAFDTRSVP